MPKKLVIIMGGGGHSTEMHHILSTSTFPFHPIFITHPNPLPIIHSQFIFYISRPISIKQSHSVYTLYSYIQSTLKLVVHFGKCDYVLCNGPGICILFVVLQKMMGCKIVYVESIARCGKLSVTGWILEWVVDVFVVQSRGLVKNNRIYHNFFFEE